jgi:GT2 family glycosyltransferase
MLPSGWLEKVFTEFSLNPNTVSLSGPFRYHDLEGFKKFVAEGIWNISAPPAYFFAGYMILGANFVARKKALLAIGGFDKNIDFYGEDTNLARRLSRVGKAKFSMKFFIYGSGRRLMGNGFLKTEFLYGMNFLWEVLFKRPFTRTYKDIR